MDPVLIQVLLGACGGVVVMLVICMVAVYDHPKGFARSTWLQLQPRLLPWCLQFADYVLILYYYPLGRPACWKEGVIGSTVLLCITSVLGLWTLMPPHWFSVGCKAMLCPRCAKRCDSLCQCFEEEGPRCPDHAGACANSCCGIEQDEPILLQTIHGATGSPLVSSPPRPRNDLLMCCGMVGLRQWDPPRPVPQILINLVWVAIVAYFAFNPHRGCAPLDHSTGGGLIRR